MRKVERREEAIEGRKEEIKGVTPKLEMKKRRKKLAGGREMGGSRRQRNVFIPFTLRG